MGDRSGMVRRALLVVLALAGCATFQEGATDVPIPEEATFVEVDGWRILARQVGESGPPILLVHGYSAMHLEWQPVVEGLCRGFRCYLVDLPGFGWSDKFAGDYSPGGLAEVLARVMDRLGLESAHVVAHSWGSSVALALAINHPQRVQRLVLVGAWVYFEQLPTFLRWARVPGLGEAIFTAFFSQQPEMRYEQVYFDPDRFASQGDVDGLKRFFKRKGVVRAALQAARDQRLEELAPGYPTVEHETLLIWGEEDRVSLPFFARRLAADLPHARLEWLARCGHLPHHEDAPGFIALVRAFLGADDRRSGETIAGGQP